MKKSYDIIYSIGADCNCASCLREAQLRICSGPFDWLLNVPFENRVQLLIDGCKNFLNKEDLIALPKNPNAPRHDTNCNHYHNTRTGFYFLHDFKIEEEFQTSFDAVKRKYERRIRRFYSNLTKRNKILLVWYARSNQTTDQTVIAMAKQFNQKIGKEIDFLIVEEDEHVSTTTKYILNSSVTRFSIPTAKDSKGKTTNNANTVAFKKILSEYQLSVPLLKKINYKKALILCLCALIPIRTLRKKLRTASLEKIYYN